ncbi:unnamed protein product [Paramecium primaurelia]|uniref:Uncharacterized protein n=1 Tax=Paramecium primaurelia TaxID=5886 RepID=A0A8S1NMI5_PARPR|nr:unnamed protein product [Paramecium primaurelia]
MKQRISLQNFLLELEQNCQEKLLTAVQHTSVMIVKIQEFGDNMKADNDTKEEGKLQLYFFLSKSQVKNNIFEGFTTSQLLLIIPFQSQKFYINDETITHIDIDYQSISPIKDIDCTDDIQKISHNNDQSQILIECINLGKKQLKGNNK